jgi:hypothetical protein
VNAAQGLVNGLASQQAALETQMNKLAKTIVNAIKRALRIKSPSQVFQELGQLTMDGLAKGFDDGGAGAAAALTNAAGNIIDTAKGAFGEMSGMLDGVMDLDPTITPILDLSNVEKDAQKLSDLTNVTPITAAASYQQASSISTAQSAAADQAATDASAGPTFKFEQNNYSPESLSEIEIYRQTKNQFSQLKTLVGV